MYIDTALSFACSMGVILYWEKMTVHGLMLIGTVFAGIWSLIHRGRLSRFVFGSLVSMELGMAFLLSIAAWSERDGAAFTATFYKAIRPGMTLSEVEGMLSPQTFKVVRVPNQVVFVKTRHVDCGFLAPPSVMVHISSGAVIDEVTWLKPD
jgi:hypothetical protein